MIKKFRAEDPSRTIIQVDVANELVDGINAFENAESDPPGLIESVEVAGEKAVIVFATERVIFVQDGIPCFFDVIGVNAGAAVDDNPL